jgi:hypothetical protein
MDFVKYCDGTLFYHPTYLLALLFFHHHGGYRQGESKLVQKQEGVMCIVQHISVKKQFIR